MDKVKVAVIGAGGIARSVHLPSLAEMADVEIVAVCDLLEDCAADLAETFAIPRVYTTYRKMLTDVQADAIYSLVEPGNLFHVTWHSLDAGCHVFMEKPPGITCFQAESLARKADQAGQLLQVGFNRRHIPLVRTVKELIERHTRVTVVEGCFYKCGTGAFDRGSMSAFASDTIHAVDLVRWIAGGTPVKTAAVLAGYDEPFVNAWSAVTRFDNGVTGVIKGNYNSGGRVHKFEIHGPGVSAYLNLGFGPAGADAVILSHKGKVQYSLAARGEGGEEIVRIDGKELAGSEEFHKYYGFWQEDRHFIDCVRSGVQPETNIHDAVESFRWVEQIAASGI
jgi:predicted dehydrogenase